ncbi:hypothetical protein GCM10025857_36430 [Alicyclobacillus contaminans]|uniref:NUDIX hydrolase n=1 Tax=Alicyclobacillus contaminans TaxID=392016 RepID=UPI00041F7AA4|nr:hypothetical protein [Alicyclobacillus contaminans]GMA52286.1 hypothetical protein GCM10025857_36430 [Alicyclobacillus contaminans]
METTAIREAPPIRPAASLILVRDGRFGLEALILKRSASMRFLPGHLAYPGGALDAEDWAAGPDWWRGRVRGRQQSDDEVYARAALRECAEEIGWLCGVDCESGVYALRDDEQRALLSGDATLRGLVSAHAWRMNAEALKFVGRWVTPPHMPKRFDTRFFIFAIQGEGPEPRLHESEHEWVRWERPSVLLSGIESGEYRAAIPTVAVLRALNACTTAAESANSLSVPGPAAR